MKINQAFTTLSRAGGVRAARIITDAMPNITRWRVMRMARQLRRGVPVAKIIHQKWFYGLRFYTNRHTLDPRPDTETIVSAVIADYGTAMPNILDLGTGTGCIICAIATNIPGARGVGIDISCGARRVARINVRRMGLADHIAIRHGNFAKKMQIPGAPFDVIVANPPYIARGDARVDNGAMHDPARALYAANNGLAAYTAIAKNAFNLAKNGAKIYLEIGQGQSDDVSKIFSDAGWTFVRSEFDLGGIERVLVFSRGI